MAASVETEKDDGSGGGGSSTHVTQPALTRAAYPGRAFANYKAQRALCLPLESRQVQVAALHSGACSLPSVSLCRCL